jgi:PAS domain S-box-containing protein
LPVFASENVDTTDLVATRDALRDSNARFRTLADAMPQMVWSTLPDGFHDYYNSQWYNFTGVPTGSTDGKGWEGVFHPDDRPEAWKRWNHSLATGEPYEVEYRLRHRSGNYRWTIGRALPIRDGEGKIIRWMGTCTDIDNAKRNAEQNEILSRELSHRIKNIFAVIGGLVGLSVRRHPEAKAYGRELQARIAALARAHEFVRPHSEQSAPYIAASTLHAMLHDLFAAYPALNEGRLTISGDDVAIDDRGATPVALVFHELATNAAKYGALSVADGAVAVASSVNDDAVSVVWIERNGPEIAGPPERTGFGSQLAELSIVQQLGGTIKQTWDRVGLTVHITVPAGRLTRSE